jgi:hypothetical protein
MPDRTIVTLVPRTTPPVRPVEGQTFDDVPGIAPVVPLRPVTMHGNTVHRLIQPLDVRPGTRLIASGDPSRLTGGHGFEPGPLARALMQLDAADR